MAAGFKVDIQEMGKVEKKVSSEQVTASRGREGFSQQGLTEPERILGGELESCCKCENGRLMPMNHLLPGHHE